MPWSTSTRLLFVGPKHATPAFVASIAASVHSARQNAACTPCHSEKTYLEKYRTVSTLRIRNFQQIALRQPATPRGERRRVKMADAIRSLETWSVRVSSRTRCDAYLGLHRSALSSTVLGRHASPGDHRRGQRHPLHTSTAPRCSAQLKSEEHRAHLAGLLHRSVHAPVLTAQPTAQHSSPTALPHLNDAQRPALASAPTRPM